DKGKLKESHKSVNGKPSESATYTWSGSDRRYDSVYTPSGTSSSPVLTRIFQNQFRNDSLVQRETLVQREAVAGKPSSEPYEKEIITYNGLGGRAYEETYLEGFTSTLDASASYAYDDKG